MSCLDGISLSTLTTKFKRRKKNILCVTANDKKIYLLAKKKKTSCCKSAIMSNRSGTDSWEEAKSGSGSDLPNKLGPDLSFETKGHRICPLRDKSDPDLTFQTNRIRIRTWYNSNPMISERNFGSRDPDPVRQKIRVWIGNDFRPFCIFLVGNSLNVCLANGLYCCWIWLLQFIKAATQTLLFFLLL